MTRAIPWLVLLLAAGCDQGGVKPPIPGQLDPYQGRQVLYVDQDLANRAPVSAPVPIRDQASGNLIVTLSIRAATNDTLRVEYRATFKDANDQVLSQTGWLPKTLYPNVFDQIEVRSTSPQARSFQIDLRYAR